MCNKWQISVTQNICSNLIFFFYCRLKPFGCTECDYCSSTQKGLQLQITVKSNTKPIPAIYMNICVGENKVPNNICLCILDKIIYDPNVC